jgi:hypothetical protein
VSAGGAAGSVGAAGAGGGGAFLPKKSSPTSALNQSSLPRGRSPDDGDGADVGCAGASGTAGGEPSLAAPAAGADAGAGTGFFLKKLNMEDRASR